MNLISLLEILGSLQIFPWNSGSMLSWTVWKLWASLLSWRRKSRWEH